jgi:hypothetical protein
VVFSSEIKSCRQVFGRSQASCWRRRSPFGFSNRSIQCFLDQKKKKRETCRETEKGLVIYVHDLNQMSVVSCRCNEEKKMKKNKKK